MGDCDGWGFNSDCGDCVVGGRGDCVVGGRGDCVVGGCSKDCVVGSCSSVCGACGDYAGGAGREDIVGGFAVDSNSGVGGGDSHGNGGDSNSSGAFAFLVLFAD